MIRADSSTSNPPWTSSRPGPGLFENTGPGSVSALAMESGKGKSVTRSRCGFAAFMVAALAVPSPAEAQKAVYLVRHAEKAGDDLESPLTTAGTERAQALAQLPGPA